MADITQLFWGSPQVFWCIVGLWILMLIVILFKFLLELGDDTNGSDE